MDTSNSNLVSVIIPCYNQAHFLGEALTSVQQQSYTPLEIIVVDDGSKDETASVAARYPHVRCLRQSNRGLSAARNAGFQHSQGEFIIFLDADDRLLPDALTVGVESLLNHPACAFAYGHVRLISADGQPLYEPHQPPAHANHYLALLRANFIWTPGAVIYPRWALEKMGAFETGIDAAADFELNLRLAQHAPVYCHEQTVLEYRKHYSNMSGHLGLMLRSCVTVLLKQQEFVSGNVALQQALNDGLEEVRRGYGDKLVAAVRHQWTIGEWSKASQGLLDLLRYHPKGAVKACLPRRVLEGLRHLRMSAVYSRGAG